MDQAIGGKSFQVPPRERIPKASPKLPFVDRKFPEPEIQEVEEEVTPVSIHEQRPSSLRNSYGSTASWFPQRESGGRAGTGAGGWRRIYGSN
ncbi:MAG: hypothetical protein ACLR2E_04095 [Lachnospiraceae bacterium]